MTITPIRTLTGSTIRPAPESSPCSPRVIKSGGSADLRLQYDVMARAGEYLFPKLFWFREWENAYCMEELLRPPVPLNYQGVIARLEEVRDCLPSIWRYSPLEYERVDWQQETHAWLAQHAAGLQSAFQNLYTDRFYYGECLIHGDPTLSNMMLSDSLQLKLIDPAPPRFAVPQLPEVDLGKLLQSLAGWEALFVADWPQVDDMKIRGAARLLVGTSLLDRWGVRLQERAIFWGAFHCMRAAVRYNTVPRIREWGLKRAEMFVKMLNDQESS